MEESKTEGRRTDRWSVSFCASCPAFVCFLKWKLCVTTVSVNPQIRIKYNIYKTLLLTCCIIFFFSHDHNDVIKLHSFYFNNHVLQILCWLYQCSKLKLRFFIMFLLKIYVFVSRFYCFKRFHSIFITLTEQHCLYQTAGLLQADSITHCPGLLSSDQSLLDS